MFFFYFSVPKGKPVFISANNKSATSVELNWKPPDKEDIHGEFQGYLVTLKERITPKNKKPAPDIKLNITNYETTVSLTTFSFISCPNLAILIY